MMTVILKEKKTIEIIEENIKTLGGTDVAIKMISVGVCGSDMQVFAGNNKYMEFPVIPFHEGVGIVHSVGDSVKEFSVGDNVVIFPILSCKKCKPCITGFYNACEDFKSLGVQADGLGREIFVIDKEYVFAIPKDLPIDRALFIEPFAVGVHAARRTNVKDKNVVIIGGGTIGNFAAQASKLMGAKKVAIFDISEDKISMAKNSGIDIAINTLNKNFKSLLEEVFGDDVIDVLIDCAGVGSIVSEAVTSMPKTSTIIIVANHSREATVDLSKIQRNELNVLGCITYTKEDFELAIEYVSDGSVYLNGFITCRYNIKDIFIGMTRACEEKGQIMKMVFDF